MLVDVIFLDPGVFKGTVNVRVRLASYPGGVEGGGGGGGRRGGGGKAGGRGGAFLSARVY